MTRQLLSVSAVNMSNFVFDTNDISTIRGGSFRLLDVIAKLEQKLRPAQVISTASSQGLYLLDSVECAERLKHDILEHLEQQTHGHATFVVATTPYDDGDDFQQKLARLEADIHRQQMRRPTVRVPDSEALIDGAPPAEQCYLDGWRPAVEKRNYESVDGPISASVAFRNDHGRRLRDAVFSEVVGDGLRGTHCTYSLPDLATDSTRGGLEGRIAIIFADGNSFGEARRQTCTSPDLRTRFDDRVQGMRNAFLKELALAAHNDHTFRKGADLRIEVLMWGGDEFMLVVPAWKGLETLRRFYQCAKDLAMDEDTPLTHRGAIIFCHHNAPIVPIRRLAEDLLGSSKADLWALAKETARTAEATADAETPSADDPETPKVSGFLSHAQGDGFHYLNLESFDMLGGHLSDFCQRYYAKARYADLLIHAKSLDETLADIATIKQHLSHEKAITLAHKANAGSVDEIATVLEKAYRLMSTGSKAAVETAIRRTVGNKPARWYLVNDLWDYLPDGGAS